MKNFLVLFFIFIGFQFSYGQAQMSAIKSLPIDFGAAEIKPVFPGGNAEFSKFISKNFVAPSVEGLNGTVLISFVVETDGSIADVKIIKEIGSGSGQAAVKMISKSPKWSPGELEGKLVRVRYDLPISIKNY